MENLNTIRETIEQRVFVLEEDKNYKSMMFSADGIRFSSKKTYDPDEFIASFEKAQNKTLTLTLTAFIPYAEVKHFRHLSGEKTGQLSYRGLKISWPRDFKTPDGATDVHNIFTYLEKVHGFRRSEQPLSVGKAILPNLLFVALAAGLTWVLYSMATGEVRQASSARQRAKAEIFQVFADMLGPSGALLVGFAAMGLAAWFLFKKIQQPPLETRLEY